GPDGAAEAVAFRQAGDREFDLARNTGIHGGAEIFAGGEARAEATALEAANEAGAEAKRLHGMHRAAVEAIDDARLPLDAGDDAAVVEKRHEIARPRFGAQQVVGGAAIVQAGILLAEGGVEPFGRILDVVDAVPGQRI